MSINPTLQRVNNQLLDYLTTIHRADPKFLFGVRVQNNKGRMEEGQWFQGDGNNYTFFSFYKAGDKKNKTKTIGFVIHETPQKELQKWIEIVYPAETDQNLINFYQDIKRFIADSLKIDLTKNILETRKWGFHLRGDYLEQFKWFVETIKPYIDQQIVHHGLEKQFNYTEKEFDKNLQRILKFKEKLEQPPIEAKTETGMSNNKTPRNKILYGPPGTGKTYNSIRYAVSIVNPNLKTDDRKTLKKEFDALASANQVFFTTFHQSMSYEDFIEGIKPLKPQDGDTFVKYAVEDGIFKNACAHAAYFCYEEYKKSKSKPSAYGFDELYESFIDHIAKQMKSGKPPIYKSLTGKEITVIEINSNASIKARAKDSVAANNPAPLTKENIQKLYDTFDAVEEIKNLKQIQDVVEVTVRHTEFYAVFKALKAFEKDEFTPELDDLEQSDTVERISVEEKLRKFNSGVYHEAIKEFGGKAKPVVLVIDEINRGNVSQIFGELITLIEEDKRLGREESLEVLLPYSKAKFGVPPNLYILGTMNTADRSIEALDTALRRRFCFEEILPNPNLLSPSAMYCRLLWKYEAVGWASKEYQQKENSLFELLGVSEELISARKSIWEKMAKDDRRQDYQYFDGFEYKGINFKSLLKTINKRIEILLDREHTIGHSFFLNVNDEGDLRDTFRNSIIPLLQEYFYGDYEKIRLIIGDDFFDEPLKYNGSDFAVKNSLIDLGEGACLKLKTINEDFNIREALIKMGIN